MEKQNVLERLSRGLKHERLAYRIMGIFLLVISIICIIIGTITMIGGGAAVATSEPYVSNDIYNINGEESVITEGAAIAVAGVGIMAFGGFYLGLGFSILAISIVNLVMASKVGKYRLNEELTVKHASSVGSIVLAAIFNEIALIFVIINFVIAKKNRAVL